MRSKQHHERFHFNSSSILNNPQGFHVRPRLPSSWTTSIDAAPPALTSGTCTAALSLFFQDAAMTAVATESSSHVSGLESVLAQPWVYAGGGLGNMDECPLQTCIAGAGLARDSVTFAAICIVPECNALDLASPDFIPTAQRVLNAIPSKEVGLPDIAEEYVTNLFRIEVVNNFLRTGWTCGNFEVEWTLWSIPYTMIWIIAALLSLRGTVFRRISSRQNKSHPSRLAMRQQRGGDETTRLIEDGAFEDEKKQEYDIRVYSTYDKRESALSPKVQENENWFWSAFDVSEHLRMLITQHSVETACLDGFRCFSLLWIVMGHVMAIVSTSGAGYSNPANFLPPHGLTTTVMGQLLFSSRLAVDSFLCISGYLVVHVLLRKLSNEAGRPVLIRYAVHMPQLFLARLVRILPLYAITLGFYTQLAPHMGAGPFWYQWLALLKPCHDYGWTNFLFINNFFPRGTAVTDTCFYHSWYLAVDMQLFLLAPLLTFWYQAIPRQGLMVTAILFIVSVVYTAYLAYVRSWSINTFDGAAVARYDVEAYAKPHIRAQSYLAGMFLAMLLHRKSQHETDQDNHFQEINTTREVSVLLKRSILELLAILSMALITFGTASGAYARRPCQYKEWPQKDFCGSLWDPMLTFLYTAFSRTVWIVGMCTLMYLCLTRSRHHPDARSINVLAAILSWRCWTPLSQLAFGVYLIHPIVIFVWKLGDREKQVFRLITFGMNVLSVVVISYVAALLAALLIELPCATLWKNIINRQLHRNKTRPTHI